MRLKSLRLVNFCCYADRTFEFGRGVTGIVGPNGSGKSTIPNGVAFALTGATSNAGTKSADIRDGTAKGVDAYVELLVAIGDVDYKVTRFLQPRRPAVIESGSGRLEGDQIVTDEIQRLLQLSPGMIFSTVLVPQKEICGLFNATPSQRLDLFQSIFGLRDAPAVKKLLTDTRKGEGIPQVICDLDAANMEKLAAAGRLADAESQVAMWTPQVEFAKQSAAYVVRYRDRLYEMQQHQQELESCTQRLAELETGKPQMEAAAADHRIAVEQFQQTANELQQTVTAIREQLAAAAVNATIYENNEKARVAVEQCNAVVQQWSERLAVLNNAIELQESEELLSNRRDRLMQRIAENAAAAATLDSNIDTCPTCLEKITTPEARNRLAAAHTTFTESTAELAQVKETLADTVRTKTERDLLVAKLAHEQYRLATVSDTIREVDYTVATHQELLRKAKEVQEQLTAVNNRLADSRNAARHAETAVSAATANIQSLRISLTALQAREIVQLEPPSEAVVAAANQLSRLEAALLAAKTQAATEAGRIQQLEAEIRRAVEARTKAEAIQRWVNVLDVATESLDSAVRETIVDIVTDLGTSINFFLEMFDAPFRVRVEEGLLFTAAFADGRKLPDTRLSPAQQVVLSLSVRLSLSQMLLSGVRTLFLDEPTAWLDEKSIGNLGEVLEKMRSYAASSDLDVVVITHEKSLCVFDNLISTV